MVEKIEAFITSDGKLFINELDAYKHECDYLENCTRKGFITKNNINIEYVKMFTVDSMLDYGGNSYSRPPHKLGVYMWFDTVEKMGYVGSTDDLFRRCSDFLNVSHKYSGKKIQEARKNGIGNFVFLLLEYVDDETKLIERETYYIEKYDTIKNGYNIKLPIEHPLRNNKKYTDEEKNEINRVKYAKNAYATIIKHINEWGLKIGNTLTLENWTNNYKIGGDALSFRLSCFIKHKDIVEYKDLLPTGVQMKMLLDKPNYGYIDEYDVFPSSMIRYRLCDKKYLAVNNNCMTFDTDKEALIFYLEENVRTKILGYLKDENIISIVRNMSIEDLIKLKYKDCDKIINFLHDKQY